MVSETLVFLRLIPGKTGDVFGVSSQLLGQLLQTAFHLDPPANPLQPVWIETSHKIVSLMNQF
jgi:hypothetical protein